MAGDEHQWGKDCGVAVVVVLAETRTRGLLASWWARCWHARRWTFWPDACRTEDGDADLSGVPQYYLRTIGSPFISETRHRSATGDMRSTNVILA